MGTAAHSPAPVRPFAVKARIVLTAALGLCLAAYLVLHVGFAAVLAAAFPNLGIGFVGVALATFDVVNRYTKTLALRMRGCDRRQNIRSM